MIIKDVVIQIPNNNLIVLCEPYYLKDVPTINNKLKRLLRKYGSLTSFLTAIQYGVPLVFTEEGADDVIGMMLTKDVHFKFTHARTVLKWLSTKITVGIANDILGHVDESEEENDDSDMV